MLTLFELCTFGVVVVTCAMLGINAIVGFVRAARGIDEDAVQRRLSETSSSDDNGNPQINLIRTQRDTDDPLKEYLPFYDILYGLVSQSGTPLSLKTAIIIAGIASTVVLALIVFLVPGRFMLFAIPFGLASGIGSVLLYLVNARSVRTRTFEEQFPDAIDLMVRSLRIGHPLSAAIAVIAREMPAPLGEEFALVQEKINYGLSIPDAFREMSEHVPLADLGYLVAAIQIHEEAGGNLIESLSKLGAVIRERFRMFRKAKAISAEGRLSAWLLSCFPIVIAFVIQLVKPGYFDQVAARPSFPYLVALTAAMLILNVVVMLKITKLKV